MGNVDDDVPPVGVKVNVIDSVYSASLVSVRVNVMGDV